MRNWRTMVGALCIVLAMMLGAFAGFVYARDAGVVGASPEVGTRGEDRRLASAFDEAQKALTVEEAEDLAAGDSGGLASITGSEPIETATPEGNLVARAATLDELKYALQQGQSVHLQTNDGMITVMEPDPETRGHWVGGEIDAGGPYGGASTFEGDTLSISVTIFDPTIIFLRYDFDGNGVFDFPDQAGAGPLGRWTTLTTVEHTYNDNFFTDIIVEGWDGISTTIQISSGDTLGQPSSYQWFLGMFGSTYRNMGYQFRAKKNMQVTELGHYHYVYTLYNMALWTSSGTLLGTCTPVHSTFAWNWCTLGTPVTLTLGSDYRIAIRVENYMTGLNHPSDNNVVQYGFTYYCFSTTQPNCFISTQWSNAFIPEVDFRWQETLILPDTTSDGAPLQVKNVAPTVSDVGTSPSPGLEGQPTNFVASFSDPGLDDTWEYRWIFHDGEVSSWRSVSKYSGGARVLILHSWTGDVTGIRTNVITACGNFCITVDEFDFGPLGMNRIPTLAELTAYDILVVGTNWGPIPNSNGVGDRLAEFMDAAGPNGGGIVMMSFGFYNNPTWGIGGRWETEKSPLPRGGSQFFNANLGTIYVPGHPFLDGVAAVTAFYRQPLFSVNSGATRIADWTDGTVFAAIKTDSGGRRACGLNYFPSLSISGDYARVIANAIRFCSRNADPVLKTMPIQLDALQKVYRDDHPTTTTPVDSFPVRVEVRDDDHVKLEIHSLQLLRTDDFNTVSQCTGSWPSGSTFPPGWSRNPANGFQCGANVGGGRGPYVYYYFNDPLYGTGDGHSFLRTPSFDLSTYTGVEFQFWTYWLGNYPFGTSDGYVEASVDGGATWPIEITAFHHNNPATFTGTVVKQNTLVGGFSNVQFRFRYESNDDWYWVLDDVRITALVGEVIQGLGSADGIASIANVAPTVIGGFDSALRNEAQSLLFKGFEITDPAILEPTEWFAYSWDFDDGSAVDWRYVGSLAPPRFNVLIVHTLCLGSTTSTCADYNALRDTLLKQDDVGSVTGFNFINYPFLPTAPTLNTMLQYDMIVVVTNWAYIAYQPFDLARRQVGDRLAQYIDAGRGGALTMMAVYDLSSFYGDIFSINGRYIDDDYGAFERETYAFTPGQGISILDPEHEAFVKVGTSVNSLFISPGKMKTTVGGRNNAAGQNGVLLANWANTNNPAVGVKMLNNGERTAHFGAFGRPDGADTGMLLRNLIGFAAGGIPSPKIGAFTHTYGDNGIYTVDLQVIDDDMGFVFDTAANRPIAALPGASVGHRFVTVAVDNVDPVIIPKSGTGGGIGAFIATQVCVRVSGQGGNSVTANVYQDGVLAASVTVVRESGSPNPETEKCGLLRVDVTATHTYSTTLTYSAPNGGSNPTWLIFSPWREPVSVGHGTVSYKFDFTGPGTVSKALPSLKADLLEGGRGAKIDFVAQAFDAGTDDLAFLWVWGTVDGTSYTVPNLATAVYTIHVHHSGGAARSDGTLAGPQFLGFSEPYFDRAANTGRSPMGSMGLTVQDNAVHAFDLQQTMYYVVLIVLDDDNTRGYPSTFGNDGIDMEFVFVNLG